MPASQCGAPDRQETPSVAAVLRRFLPDFTQRTPAIQDSS